MWKRPDRNNVVLPEAEEVAHSEEGMIVVEQEELENTPEAYSPIYMPMVLDNQVANQRTNTAKHHTSSTIWGDLE